jgi:ABC-type transport system involved in cytochrome c biogenesis ATPase subunit
MLESIDIRNFKCFDSLTIKDLRRVVLIGGPNNVGKTTLLEALSLLYQKTSPTSVLGQYAHRGIASVDARADVAWAPIFRNYDFTNGITIAVERGGQPESVTIELRKHFRIPGPPTSRQQSGKSIRTDETGNLLDALEFSYNNGDRTFLYTDPRSGANLHVEKLTDGGWPVIYLASRSRRSAEEESDAFGQLDRRGSADRVVGALRLVEPRLESLSIIPIAGIPVIHGKLSDMETKIPVFFMGEGTSKALTMALGLADAFNGLLLLDEIENGIHYSIQVEVWKALAANAVQTNCQVIATTHSYECLQHAHEALSGDLAKEFRYIRLDRTDAGIQPVSFDHETLETAIAAGMEVR